MNEKKEIKISLTTFIVGIIAIVLLILVIEMGMYIATQNNKKQTKPEIPDNEKVENVVNKVQEDNEKIEELDVNSEIVQELYSYIKNKWPMDVIVNTTGQANSIIYTTGQTTIDTISNDTKLMAVIYRIIQNKDYVLENINNLVYNNEYDGYELDMNNISYWYDDENDNWVEKVGFNGESKAYVYSIETISNEKIQKVAREIFNTTIQIEKHSYDFLGEAVVYDNGNYKILEYPGGGGTLFDTDHKIIKAEKYNDKIIIYDNYIASWEEMKENTYETMYTTKFYAALDKKKEIVPLKKLEYISQLCSEGKENEIEAMMLDSKKAKEEYGITLPIYKHTFKQSENGNYYWVSTELTNY